MSVIDIDTTKLHAFTPGTLLPSGTKLSPSYIHLLDNFFSVVDSLPSEPTNSQQFRSIFTADGTWKTPDAAYRGHDQLAQSGTSWEFLRMLKSFQHYVGKIYAVDAEGKDLMVLGNILMETVDGGKHDVVYSAKVDIEVDAHGEARLAFFQGWSSRV